MNKNYKLNIEEFEGECNRLWGHISQLVVLYVGLDEDKQRQLHDFAWELMREWREEQK